MKLMLTRISFLMVLSAAAHILHAQTDSIFDQGVYRKYILHLPAGYSPKYDYPLVLNFHGHNSNSGQQESYSQFDDVADALGLIVVYPNAIAGNWELSGTQDVGFVSHLIDTLRTMYSCNPCLFLTGMSQGAFMVYKLACSLPQPITGIAPVAGNMTTFLQNNCTNAAAVPVMHFHGTDDPLVSYNGDFGIPPVEETIAWWAEHNGDNDMPVVHQLDDLDPSDGCTVEEYRYAGDAGQAEVYFYKITGGGHTWPGAFKFPPLGNTTQDISASARIGDFFSGLCDKSTPVLPISASELQIDLNTQGSCFKINNSPSHVQACIVNTQGMIVLHFGEIFAGSSYSFSLPAQGLYYLCFFGEDRQRPLRAIPFTWLQK